MAACVITAEFHRADFATLSATFAEALSRTLSRTCHGLLSQPCRDGVKAWNFPVASPFHGLLPRLWFSSVNSPAPELIARFRFRVRGKNRIRVKVRVRFKVNTVSDSVNDNNSGTGELYPVYAIKQTSSNHQANIQQMHSKYTCTTCALIARQLFDRCSMFAWCLLGDCLNV